MYLCVNIEMISHFVIDAKLEQQWCVKYANVYFI